uniref:LOW QUALITY PROTEIN: tyrosine kinase receptor Cad96Ca-like n=1 Tax=Semicossyphus pulcher TaxID=241346 RepID=UPI0037E70AD9
MFYPLDSPVIDRRSVQGVPRWYGLQPPVTLNTLIDLLRWYAEEFKDPMVLDPPEWFKSFIFCEALIQLPFFPFAAYAFLKEKQGSRFTKSDLNLLQLIKAGKEGVFYQARMSRGTCKGHNMFTCKISKEGFRPKHVDMEVSIMRKLVHHKNILQLLDWNTSEEPCILIMEYVSYGTLRTFLQTNRVSLSADQELQSLLTIASYHIALAMQHLRSKMILHCDLALRNIMVNKFPWEVKVGEFGLARDLSSMASRRSSRWRNPRQRVPLRWYPPEYFKNNYYSFKGDVWAFGIVLWEMQTFGTLPYPNLDTSDAVVYHICIGHKNTNPDGCRPEILHIMRECWLEPYTLRPSFTDIVCMLENIMENDADYVDVESPQMLVKEDTEYHEAKGLRAASVSMEDTNTV